MLVKLQLEIDDDYAGEEIQELYSSTVRDCTNKQLLFYVLNSFRNRYGSCVIKETSEKNSKKRVFYLESCE